MTISGTSSTTFDDGSPLSLFPLAVGFDRFAFSSLSFILFSSFDDSFLLFIELVDARDSIRSLENQVLETNGISTIFLPSLLFILHRSG